MRNTIAQEIFKYCKINKDGFLMAGDAGFGVWEKFREECPKQYINTGINEAAMTGMAAGLCFNQHKVFMYNIIPFVLMRNFEQIRVDLAYQECDTILIGIGSGITYAPAGMTHYSVEDITIALSLPNMQIFSPADPVEGVACLRYAIQSNRLSYIRIAKSGEKKLHTNTVDITHPIYLHKSSSQNILLLHGSIADEIDLILEELDINVVSVPFINADIDWEMFLKPYKYIFTLEEHFIDGGFGSYLRDKVERKVHKFGIPNHYIHTIGDRDYLRDYFEIDGENIVRKIKDILKGS